MSVVQVCLTLMCSMGEIEGRGWFMGVYPLGSLWRAGRMTVRPLHSGVER
ncbi:MAG: hypothetical protein ACJAYX_002773, partial [Planctomycetota bacterium]